MRPVQSLVHSRARVTPRYALMPLEGYPFSRLPGWADAQVRVLASPAIGAEFVQLLIDLPAGVGGDFVPDPEIETFHFVLSGTGEYMNGFGIERGLTPGAYGLTQPTKGVSIKAKTPMQLLILRKQYEPTYKHPAGTSFYSNESKIKKEAWADNPHALLQTLLPDDFAFDLAMNIFTFSPGHGLPVVETHVMEHGLYFLEGKGLYYLGDTWMEVEKDDFIWMGPYCPQSFSATGPTPSRYIYYKNVNREITL